MITFRCIMSDKEHQQNQNWNILFAAWLITAISILGSVFFSYIMEFSPCVLCWYQRIFLFPLGIILAVGLFPYNDNAIKFSLPLAVSGWLTALYHNLLYSGIIPKGLHPCRQGVSCTEKYIEIFGFFTIPMLSLISFSIIIALLLFLKRRTTV